MIRPLDRRRGWAWVGLAVGLTVAFVLTGCGGPTQTPTSPVPSSSASSSASAALTPVPVPLSLSGPVVGQTIRLGLLVGPKAGEGSDYRDVAEGVRVAAYRFAMTGANVQIEVALDDGTVDGAAAALTSLAGRGVIGIIVASSGQHLRQAVAATPVGPAVLLPYDDAPADTTGVWSTGPTRAAVGAALTEALRQAGVSRPYLVTAPGQTGLGLSTAGSATLAADSAGQVFDALNSGAADSVIIDASGLAQAQLTAQIQQRLGSRQVPILLTPAALTPPFGGTLLRVGPPPSSLISVGPDTSDITALTTGSAGAHLSAFLTAVRLAGADPSCRNVFGDAAFTEASQTADVASHDATVALIRAAERAGTTAALAVKQTLAGLDLTGDDGLAGPALNFDTAAALGAAAVVPLHASSQDPGLRPVVAGAAPRLVWFPTS